MHKAIFPAISSHPCAVKERSTQGGLIPAHTLERTAILGGKRARIRDDIFHDIIEIKLQWSRAFDLAGVGPYFDHPLPPVAFWDGPHSFHIERPRNRQNGPFGSDSSSLSLLRSTLDAQGQPDTLLAEKQAPVFIIRNICAVIPSAVLALSTGNRISPSLPCFFSAGLTGYLLLLPQ